MTPEICTYCGQAIGKVDTWAIPESMIIQKEVCICAAIKDTTGYIWRGHRHSDCISSAMEAGRSLPHTSESTWQGFVTSANRFVNRHEGFDLQEAAGISSADRSGYRTTRRLFSEDLY